MVATRPPAGRWLGVVAIGLSVFMAAIDLTIAAVALPTIGSELDVGPRATQWVLIAYLLPMVAFLIPAGRWADAVDRRKLFLLSVLGFGITSALAGLAPTFAALLGARAAQGVFGALMSTLMFKALAPLITPDQRGRALGVIGALGPLGSASGPGLGGLLVEGPGWRWVFLVNVPVCLVTAWLGRRAIPGEDGRLPAPPLAWLAEAAVLGLGVTGVFLATQTATTEIGVAPQVLVPALLAPACAAFVVWWRLPGAAAPRDLMTRRALAPQLGAVLLVTTATGAVYYLLPFLLQQVLGRSPEVTGITVLALPLAMGLTAPLGGYLSDRLRRPKAVALAGALLVALGLALLVLIDSGVGPPGLTARLVVAGAGLGLFTGPIGSSVMAAAPPESAGTAGALVGIARTGGFATGPALAAAVWELGGAGFDGARAALGAGLAAALLAAAATAVISAPARVRRAA